jgi:hypothetical protein
MTSYTDMIGFIPPRCMETASYIQQCMSNKIPGSLEHVSCLGWKGLVAFVLTRCPYIYLPLLIYQMEQ